jgi:adenine-specific DNA-methyltransferase
MWYDILKGKKLSQYKFTRQKPLLNYIADFYCSEFGLVIEVDGDNHEDQKEYDEKRTKELESYGLEVLRFYNLRTMEEISAVENEISECIEKRKIKFQDRSIQPPNVSLNNSPP